MPANPVRSLRCAVYTRKSTEHGLDQEFNSLDAQRETGEPRDCLAGDAVLIAPVSRRFPC